MRESKNQMLLAFGIAILLLISGCDKKEVADPLLLNYKTSAKQWTEALPIGNFRLVNM